jgi:hypothetical protein
MIAFAGSCGATWPNGKIALKTGVYSTGSTAAVIRLMMVEVMAVILTPWIGALQEEENGRIQTAVVASTKTPLLISAIQGFAKVARFKEEPG